MATLIFESIKSPQLKEIKLLANKLGLQFSIFTKNQEEDFKLGQAMKKSKKCGLGN